MNKLLIERINNNFQPMCTYEIAKDYLCRVVRYGGKGVLLDKENILNMLKIIIAEDFDIGMNQIKYRVVDLTKLEGNAFIDSNWGDHIYRVKIDETFMEESTNLEFLYVLLHEFGHLKQYLNALKGKRLRKSVITRAPEIYTTTPWQQRGAHYRYYSNDNEHYADMYAFSKMLNWVREESKKNCPKSKLFINKKKLKKDRFYTRFDHALNKIKFIAWH